MIFYQNQIWPLAAILNYLNRIFFTETLRAIFNVPIQLQRDLLFEFIWLRKEKVQLFIISYVHPVSSILNSEVLYHRYSAKNDIFHQNNVITQVNTKNAFKKTFFWSVCSPFKSISVFILHCGHLGRHLEQLKSHRLDFLGLLAHDS